MADALAENKGGEARPMLLPGQLLLLGPPLVPIWVAGIVTVFRRPGWRALRAFPVAYGVILVMLLVLAGQFYYVAGLLLVLFAFGAVAVQPWLQRRRRAGLIAALVVLNVVVSAVIVLPVLPEKVLGDSFVPGINQTAADQVGWPRYVEQVAAVHRSLPAPEQASTVLITGNYGEAGALDRFGAPAGLPPAYSGQNELFELRRPPSSTRTAIVVLNSDRADAFLATVFGRCRIAGTLDNGSGVDNEEQGTPIRVCTQPKDDWARLWPRFQHFD
jgi:hypothetical protein